MLKLAVSPNSKQTSHKYAGVTIFNAYSPGTREIPLQMKSKLTTE